jgi:hypothetical protein
LAATEIGPDELVERVVEIVPAAMRHMWRPCSWITNVIHAFALNPLEESRIGFQRPSQRTVTVTY